MPQSIKFTHSGTVHDNAVKPVHNIAVERMFGSTTTKLLDGNNMSIDVLSALCWATSRRGVAAMSVDEMKSEYAQWVEDLEVFGDESDDTAIVQEVPVPLDETPEASSVPL